jgi:hypothetical protein
VTPSARAALITRAKALSIPVASCVAASLRPDHLLSGCTWDELAALVVVLAESADPVRLRAVAEAADDGLPARGQRAFTLRRAHADFEALRLVGGPVPERLRVLEREYQRDAARRKRAAASGGVLLELRREAWQRGAA